MSLDLAEETKVIGGLTYRVKPLSTRQSLRLMTRVLNLAAPGFANVQSLRAAAAATTSALGGFLAGAAEDLDDETVEMVCRAFAEVTVVETAPGKRLALKGDQWDDHFRGKLFELFEWLRFAGEVTYGPFVQRLQAEAPAPPAPEAAPPAP